MRGSRGARSIAVLVSLVAFASPAGADAATVVGQAPPVAGAPTACDPGWSFVAGDVSSGPSYVVPPPGGVITEWRHQATDGVGQRAALRVFVPVAGSGQIILAESEPVELAPSTLNAFPTRLPAPAGSRLGLRTETAVSCGYMTGPGDTYFAETPPRPVGGIQGGSAFGGLRLNVAAVVEPDADRDLYGDESQDGCPTVASLQTDCVPPETTLTAKPRKRTKKRRARFEFTASEPGSTFECSLDGRPARPCTSPFVTKRLKRRRHTFAVTATDPHGNRDPSPAEHRFKVVKKKRGKRR